MNNELILIINYLCILNLLLVYSLMASEDVNNLANQFDGASIDSGEDIRHVINIAQIDPSLFSREMVPALLAKSLLMKQ